MKYFPYFIGQTVEFLVSIRRLQKFLVCDTVNTSQVRHLDEEDGNDEAITIADGNFFWGVK